MSNGIAAVLLFSIAAAAQTSPTYSKDVAPLFYKNCVSCHRAGEIAPMSLLTYDQVRPWAKSIRERVALGTMPPWHSDAPRGTFENDRRLTEADKATILKWVDAGAPQGDPKDLPPMPKFTEGWEIGKPDAVLTMTRPYVVPATGTVNYQYAMIPTNFTEDKWVQSIEVRPGARQVVHHVLVFMREAKGTKPRKDVFTQVVPNLPSGLGPGTLLATTAPGTNAMTFEPGTAMKITAGATLILQIHYTANGKEAVPDQTSVGMIFAKEPPQKEMRTSAFMNPFLLLPAGAADTAVPSAIVFDRDVHITALFPHTHLRGKAWEYTLVYPDGHKQVVLPVPAYDFNWQTYYIFSKPLAAPKGSRLEAVAHYDNSVNNKANPDPTKPVRWGEQTWQEMQYSGINYTVDSGSAESVPTGGQ
ncbi:MAG TPA: hypothetical protein VG273_18575 [Bryobacteraceae bacterium]|jgi:hypothetical protein|nr:hypothetical protein [Bryobacteraceae bacterium]